MKKKYYIGLDQGTTGTTTLLLDETVECRSQRLQGTHTVLSETGLGRARSAGTLAESDGIYVHGIV